MLYQGSIYYAHLDVPKCILLKKNKISAFHQVVLGESAYSYTSVDWKFKRRSLVIKIAWKLRDFDYHDFDRHNMYDKKREVKKSANMAFIKEQNIV